MLFMFPVVLPCRLRQNHSQLLPSLFSRFSFRFVSRLPDLGHQMSLAVKHYTAERVQECVDRYSSNEGMTLALKQLLIEVRRFER